MALPCGTKANKDTLSTDPRSRGGDQRDFCSPSWVHTLKLLGFFVTAGAALCIIAGLVLLPEYASLQEIKHTRDCRKVRASEAKTTLEGMERLCKDVRSDETLNKRLAFSRLGMIPKNQIVIPHASLGPMSIPGSISQVHYPNPPKPSGWLIQKANSLKNPSTQKAYIVLAASLLIAASLLFNSKRDA